MCQGSRGKAPLLMALMAALALLLAACGGSGGGSTGAGDDFVAQADSLCTKSAQDSVSILRDASPIDSPEALGAYLEELRTARQSTVDALKELSPPEGIATAWDEYVAKRQEAVDQLDEGLAAAKGGSPGDVEAARQRNRQINDEAEALAAKLDVPTCARVLSSEAEQQVRDDITEAGLSTDPAIVCDKLATDQFLESQFGGRDGCAAAQSDAAAPDDVELSNVKGVGEVSATADVKIIGGESDGTIVEVSTVYEDGAYKVDSFSASPVK